ncbi:MAG: hypothetical protein EB075_15665 [Bacteroidetes bacterium]|nr:hypothetical protein [Bacteroidota bacterium]
MEASHRDASQRGIRRISLEVACDNTGALALYTHLSYEQVGVRRGYYRRDNGTTQDALVMVRTIVPHPPANTSSDLTL